MCGVSLVLAVTFLALGLAVVQGAGALTRITIASSNDRDSLYPSLSADGTKIVFQSDSDFLGQGVSTTEIWLYDTTTMTFTRITTASASDRRSSSPSISADGTRIAFRSNSDFSGQGIPNDQVEVWLYDLAAMTLTRVTTASGIHLLDYPSLSGDGQVVAFESDFDFLGQGVNRYEIWLYDTTTMTVTRITTAIGDGYRESRNPSLNADGTKVAFRSNSDFLGQGIPDSQFEIWLYDTATMTLIRVTIAPDSIGSSLHPRLNADGTKVAFASDSDFLGQGIPLGQYEIWLYDTTTMTFTRVTTASDSNRQSAYPSLNAGGTKVAFVSDSDFLGQGIQDQQFEVWLYDTTTATYTRVTLGSASIGDYLMPNLSADGTKIAFSSDSDFLGQDIPNDQYEIWLYDLSVVPNLTLSKTVAPSPVVAGNRLTYTVSVANQGGADATGVVISDTLDGNVTFAAASGSGVYNAGVVSWNVGIVPIGQSITHTLWVTVSNVASGTLVSNTAWMTSAEGASASDTISTTVFNFNEWIYLPLVLK
jgi:uncharacterized repeat protein (TIGR01451 family)